jgi:hypothetical protein
MPPLSPDAARLVDLARSVDQPSPRDEERIRGALAQRMVVGAAATATGLGATKLAAGIGLGKLVVVVGLGSAAAAGLYATYHQVTEPTTTLTLNVPSARAGRAPPSVSTTSQPEENRTTTALKEPPRTPLSDVRHGPRRPTAESAPTPTPDLLKAETAALREAQQALRTGDPGRALSLISQQNSRFSEGLLQQERAAARIMALCQLGRTAEARAEVVEFASRWPKSPLLARVRNACGQSEN